MLDTKPCPDCGNITYDPTQVRVYKTVNPALLNSDGWICDACYQRACRAKRRITNNNLCAVCETAFTPKRKDARFCSNKCRQAAHRNKRDLKEAAE